MKNFIFISLAVGLPLISLGQSDAGDFPFGKVTPKELLMNEYDKDTSAVAVVLNEFGKAWFNDDLKILFEHLERRIGGQLEFGFVD